MEKQRKDYLLEKLKGERVPDWSMAAHPKAFTGCSFSGDFSIFTQLLMLSYTFFFSPLLICYY